MLFDFIYQGRRVHAYAVFNFKEVSDCVLLCAFTDRYAMLEKFILIQSNGKWQSHFSKVRDEEFFSALSNELSHVIGTDKAANFTKSSFNYDIMVTDFCN